MNPYSASAKRKIAVASRTGQPLIEGGAEVPRGSFGLTRAGTARASTMPLVGANGEFNATSKRELMQAIATLHGLFQAGEVEAKLDHRQSYEVRAAREQRLVEAWADKSGQSWMALGEVIGDKHLVAVAR